MKEIVGEEDPRTRAAVENYHLFCAKQVGILGPFIFLCCLLMFSFLLLLLIITISSR